MLWGHAIDDGKRRLNSDSTDLAVVIKLCFRQCKIPLLWLLVQDTPDQIPQNAIHHFCLAINLRMASAAVIQESVKTLPQSPLELTNELGIPVKGDGL